MGFFRQGALVERVTTIITSGTTTVLQPSSASYVRLTGTSSHIIELPDATLLDVGRQFTFLNRSTGSITVRAPGSPTAVVSIAANCERTLRLTDKTTAAGIWDVTQGEQPPVIAKGGGGVGVGLRPAAGYSLVSFEDFSVEDATLSKVHVSTTGTKFTADDKPYYRLSCDKTLAITTVGQDFTLSAAPSFTLAVGDIIYAAGKWVRITALASQTSGSVDNAFIPDLVGATGMVSQALFTRDLVNMGDAANALRPRDLFPGRGIRQIHVEYGDTRTADDIQIDITSAANVVVAAAIWGTQADDPAVIPASDRFNVPFIRPQGAAAVWPDYPLQGVTGTDQRLFLCFFPNPNNASVTTQANLLGYECSFYQKESLAASGYADSAFSTGGTAINCRVPIVTTSGTTTDWTLDFPYIMNANPGKPQGDLTVFFNGAKVPRAMAGLTAGTLQFSEMSSYTIRFSQALDISGGRFEVYRSNSIIDQSQTNAMRIGALWDAIVGSAAQVASGVATHSDLAAAYAAVPAGGTIFVLRAYVPTATALTFNKAGVSIVGQGRGCTLSSGSITISADFHEISGVRFGGSITISSNSNHVRGWQATGFTISNTGTANAIVVIQE